MPNGIEARFAPVFSSLVLLWWLFGCIGCGKQVDFRIGVVSRRPVTLEDVVLASDAGQRLRLGYLAKDAEVGYRGGWRILAGEELTLTWLEDGKPQSSKISPTSADLGSDNILIEIRADGSLSVRP